MRTCIDQAVLPNPTDIAFFREHGWWLSPPLYTDEELDRAIALQDRFYAGERTRDLPSSWPWDRSSGIPEDRNALRKNDYSAFLLEELQLITHKPLLGACAAALMGADSVRIWHDQLLYKPPLPAGPVDGQTSVGWHADRNYWRTCTGPLVTAWVPFTDVTPDMGPIAFLDSSQDWDLVEELNFFSDDLAGQEEILGSRGKTVRKIVPTFERGRVSFHDWRTVHGSTPNTSDRPRRSMAVHIQHGDNRWMANPRRDGELHGHANDHLVRRDADGHPDYSDPTWCPRIWPVQD